MNASSFSSLRLELGRLKAKAALLALKTGTEVEDMDFEEIAFLRRLSGKIVPLYVKIGGPEARTDIRVLADLKVDGLIAPMIESPYALKKFIETLQELLSPAVYKSTKKGINIETVTALRDLDAILALPQIRQIDQITAARTDLSASMGLKASDAHVLESCALIVARAREHGILTSIGGQIDPTAVASLIARIGPDYINSRHMVLSAKGLAMVSEREATRFVLENLNFECSLYSHLAGLFTAKKSRYKKRIETIRQRIR